MSNKEFNNVQLDVTFIQAATRSNITSGEDIATSFGKISKWFTDLKSIAWDGHPTVTQKDTTSTVSPNPEETFTVVDSVTRNDEGHVTGINVKTVKLPTGSGYVHPSHDSHESGLYKITVDELGHVSDATAVTKADITGLGIPGSDTDTTYTLSGAYGSDSNTWVTTLTPSSGSATTSTVPTASTTAYGITKLSSATDSTSTSLAATASAVKAAYDLANGKSTVSFSSSLTSGTKIGTITINGTGTDLYCQTDTDTKNTAGSTNTSSKIFLIGATSQAANPQTYSHDTAYVGTDGCLYSGGTKVLTAHPTITKSTDTTSTASPAHGGTFTVVDTVTRDSNGHVTKINTKTITLPASGNTDTKVNVTLGTTTKAYLLGTSTTPTSTATGVTAIADTGVYLDTVAGKLTATTFSGALSGNATTATTLQTARTINGVSFNGSENIIIPRSTKHIHTAAGTNGTSGYVKIITIEVIANYANHPVEFVISQRSRGPYHLYVQFNSVASTDPTLYEFKHFDPTNKGVNAYIVKSATSTWDIYIGKIEKYDHIYVLDVLKADGDEGSHYSITYTNTLVSSVPTTNQTKSTATIQSHTHSYLPLTGGTMNNDAKINIPYSTDGRIGILTPSGYRFKIPSNVGFAMGDYWYTDEDLSNTLGGIGAYGTKNDIQYFFVGGTYSAPLFKVTKSDGSGTFTGTVAATGGAFTGNLSFTMNSSTQIPLKIYGGDANGQGISVGAGAATIVGGGESAKACESLLGATTEELWLTSDTSIKFYTNCQTIGNKVGVFLNTARAFYPDTNNTGSLGTSSYYWANAYIKKLNGFSIGGRFSTIPTVGSTGVMEIGKYIDFHTESTGTSDYDVRLTAGAGTLTCSGSIAATSFSGNASSASKLATAITITLGSGLQGSTSFNGSANVTLNGSLKRCSFYDDASDWETYPWRKIASIAVGGSNSDRSITFMVTNPWASPLIGILRAHIRVDGTAGVYGAGHLKWLFLTDTAGTYIKPENFVMVYTNNSGSTLGVEIWVKNTARYNGYMFTVLDESHRTAFYNAWVLTTNPERAASYTSGTGTITSTVATLQNTTYTKLLYSGTGSSIITISGLTNSSWDLFTVVVNDSSTNYTHQIVCAKGVQTKYCVATTPEYNASSSSTGMLTIGVAVSVKTDTVEVAKSKYIISASSSTPSAATHSRNFTILKVYGHKYYYSS